MNITKTRRLGLSMEMVVEGSQNGIRALSFVVIDKCLRLLALIYDNVQK
jgi:hypothetical protein